MSFIIQELCWAWSSLLAHARDARKSAEQAGRMHASRLEISVGFRKNRNSWAAVKEKLPRKKTLRAIKHSPELHYKRGEMQNMVSETQEHLLYTWEPPAFLYGLRWISAVRKQGSSQSWKMKPVTQLHSRKGELVKTSSAATEMWIWTRNGWLLWSSAAGVQ